MSIETTSHTAAVETPYYVLMDGKHRIGPNMLTTNSKPDCIAIYGFSDKIPYENFEQQNEKLLTPYPLVKGYLSNQIAAVDAENPQVTCLRLIVLDASGPADPLINAATMEAVLEAQQNRTPHVTVTHHLTIDAIESVYRLGLCS